MGQIKNYKIINELTNDTSFVAETPDGTRRVDFDQIKNFFDDIININGIGEAKNTASDALTISTETFNKVNTFIENYNKWRKIFEITTTENVSAVEQNIDSDGNPFKLKEALVIISIPSFLNVPGSVAIDQPAVAYHPETNVDWYSLYGDSIGKSMACLIFEIKAEPFVTGKLTTLNNDSALTIGSPLDENIAALNCGGRYDIDYIDYFKLQEILNANATFPAGTNIKMWGVDKDD